MCLAAFALDIHPRFPLVIAANRDEYFDRAAAPLAWWNSGKTELLGGRDLSAGGTWFGLTRAGRLALLTNVREPARQLVEAPSRGGLVTRWLGATQDAAHFARSLTSDYNGFNLITADLAQGSWHWISNRTTTPLQLVSLMAGLYGLSNAALDTPWPKTVGLKAALASALKAPASADQVINRALAALADAEPAPDSALPNTGVGMERERELSSRFVRMADPAEPGRIRYGTRCSTVLISEVLADGTRCTQVVERGVGPDGRWLQPVVHSLTTPAFASLLR